MGLIYTQEYPEDVKTDWQVAATKTDELRLPDGPQLHCRPIFQRPVTVPSFPACVGRLHFVRIGFRERRYEGSSIITFYYSTYTFKLIIIVFFSRVYYVIHIMEFIIIFYCYLFVIRHIPRSDKTSGSLERISSDSTEIPHVCSLSAPWRRICRFSPSHPSFPLRLALLITRYASYLLVYLSRFLYHCFLLLMLIYL